MVQISAAALLCCLAYISAVSEGRFKGYSTVMKREKKLARYGDVKEEMVMIMSPNENWEQYLIPAPLTVKILAKILQVSLERDFSLEESAPRGGFNYIKFPQSFRASLVQVAGDGHRAFSVAHGSMDVIRLTCHEMPNHFKEAMQILFSGDSWDVKNLMPIPLTAISDGAERCRREADKVKSKFDDVQDLLRELLVVCTASKGVYEKRLLIAEIERDSKAKQKARLVRREKERNQTVTQMKDKQEQAEKDWKDAVNKIPGSSELLGMQVKEVLIKGLNGVMNLLTFGLAGSGMGATSNSGDMAMAPDAMAPDDTEVKSPEDPQDKSVGLMDLVIQATKILPFAKQVNQYYVYETNPDTHQRGFQFHCTNNTVKELCYLQENLKVIKAAGEEAVSQRKDYKNLKKKMTDATKYGLRLAIDMVKMLESFSGNATDISMHDRVTEFWSKAALVDSLAATFTQETPLGTSGPTNRNAKPKPKTKSESRSIAQMAVENANLKVAQFSGQLKRTSRQFERAQDAYERTLEKLDAVMEELDAAVQGVVDFKTIKKVLSKGIIALGELSQQWEKLSQFFSMIKNLIDVTLSDSIKKYVEYSTQASERRLAGMNLRQLHQDMVYNNAFRAIKIAYLVEHVSSAYVKVSSKHILSRIAGIARIVGYDPATERALIQNTIRNITNGCQEASDMIRVEMIEHKKSFERKIDARVANIRKELKDTLPTPPREIMEVIAKIAENIKKDVVDEDYLDDDDDDDEDDDDDDDDDDQLWG